MAFSKISILLREHERRYKKYGRDRTSRISAATYQGLAIYMAEAGPYFR
jgi:hypothetical protein